VCSFAKTTSLLISDVAGAFLSDEANDWPVRDGTYDAAGATEALQWHCSCERRDVLKGDNGVVLNGAYRSALTFWVSMEFQSWSMKKIYSSFPLFHSCLKPVVKKTFDTCLILLQLRHKRFFTFFVFN